MKPGDVVTFEGVYQINPEPERVNAKITSVKDSDDETVFGFEPITTKDAEILRRHFGRQTPENKQ